MDQVKIVVITEENTYFLNGLLLNEEYALYSETSDYGTTIFYAKVQFNEEFKAYEIISSGNIDDYTSVPEPMKALYEVREALHEINLYTLITKFGFWIDDGFGLIGENGKVKEWKHEK